MNRRSPVENFGDLRFTESEISSRLPAPCTSNARMSEFRERCGNSVDQRLPRNAQDLGFGAGGILRGPRD